MLKFCKFCGHKLDKQGFCNNAKCPDFKRKEIIETEQITLTKEKESTAQSNDNKA